MKKSIVIFRAKGRSIRWKNIDKSIKNMLAIRKGIYFDKETERLKNIGRGAGWFPILNKIDENGTKEWNITQLEPEKTPKQIATDLASHFSLITNQTTELDPPLIKSRNTSTPLIPQLLESTVCKTLKEYKKTASMVPGDIPPKLVNENVTALSKPLPAIYNVSLATTKWPKQWKVETLVPKT